MHRAASITLNTITHSESHSAQSGGYMSVQAVTSTETVIIQQSGTCSYSNTYAAKMGAWIYNTQNSVTLTVADSTFNTMTASSGNGGLVSTSCSSASQVFSFTNSKFETIAASAGSGGVFYMCGQNTNTLIIDSTLVSGDTFASISASASGGVVWQTGAASSI